MSLIAAIKPLLTGVSALLMIASFNALGQENPAMQRSVLLQNQVDLPSSEITAKVMKVVFAPGFKTPWHTHEGPGPRYVVKGQLEVTEAGKTQTYKAGEVFWETGERMAVENIGKSEAELIIFEMAPAK
ncbi:hypothetical protein JCM14076_13460 [Methylosoma difficile]